MQRSGVVGVGVSEIDGDEFLAFQLEPVALKLLDADEVFRDLSREASVSRTSR